MTGILPVGVIMATGQASGPPAAGWLPCDGSAHAMVGVFADLSAVISWNYGGDGVTVFNVPDFRGRFLRGTDHATDRDPDARSRTASAPGGLTGDNVGSAQNYATAMPKKPFVLAASGDHTHSIANVPAEDHNTADSARGPLAYNIMEWNSGNTPTSTDGDHSHTLHGGDAETRPINIYLDWWIAQHDLDDAPPIGSVVPFGGDTTQIDVLLNLAQKGWLVCNAAKLNRQDPKYHALFATIGTTYGGDALTFRTPGPVHPFTASADGSHTHTIDNVPPDTHSSDIVVGTDCAAANSNATATSTAGSHTHTLAGAGDNETRPINVNVDYIIRYA